MTSENSFIKINQCKVMVQNGELCYESFGEGEPLILIHAGFSDRRDWKHQIEDFSKKFNTIIYDQRGSGNSSVVVNAFSPADDLKALMDHLKIQKATLIGHSIGGTIALDFALQYPERISTLVLIASGLNGYSWSKEYLALMGEIWSVLQPEEMTKKFLSAPFYSIGMSKANIKSEIEIITQESFQKILDWKTFNVQDVHWFFSDPILKIQNLKIPTLIIYGDKDSDDIKQIAKILVENIKNARAIEMKNVDHLLNFEKPKELNNLILDFLLTCNLK